MLLSMLEKCCIKTHAEIARLNNFGFFKGGWMVVKGSEMNRFQEFDFGMGRSRQFIFVDLRL